MGNIDVGDKTPPCKPNPSRTQHQNCGAMTLQSGDSGWGNQSAPQKLLHLVGCREAKARPDLPKHPDTAKR